MGSAGAKASGNLSLSDLPKVLGDGMPDLPRDRVGRHRLVRALQQRFGQNFRSLPGLKGIIKEFDSELEFEGRVRKLKQIKYSKKKD